MALLAFVLLVPSALATPTLSVEASHFPQQINRGDESVRYEVRVRNTSVTDPTSSPLEVAISLPPGLTLRAASGGGWSCSLTLLSCSNATVVAAGGAYPVLQLSPVWIDGTAPGTVRLGAAASGAGATIGAVGEDSFTFGPAVPFGVLFAAAIAADEDGAGETQAGAHPYEAFGAFETTRRRGVSPGVTVPVEDLHGSVSELPAGMVGNPEAADAACDFADVVQEECPSAAAVGGVEAFTDSFEDGGGGGPGPESRKDAVVYRLPHETGYPASFGFTTLGVAFVIRFGIRSNGDYGLSEVIRTIARQPVSFGASFAFCGYGVKFTPGGTEFDRCKRRGDPDANPRAFLTLGTECASGPRLTRFGIDSWTHRGAYTDNGLPDLSDPGWSTRDVHSPALTDCERLTREWTGGHEPSFGFQSDSHAADSPAAYSARLHVPQGGLEDPDGLATSHLMGATLSLPPGLSFNPAIGDGLAACSEEQIGLIGAGFPPPNRVRFDTRIPRCPKASKLGTASVDTPLLEDTLHGSIFLAAQEDNPFDSDYAIYLSIEAEGPGIVAKLPGKVELDPDTGQVTATFVDGPQLPFEDLELEFFGGARSVFASPVTCGDHRVTTELTPWSAADPERPRADEIARPSDEVSIASGPRGAPCVFDPADRPFEIGLAAGPRDPIAGTASPFSFRITRPDGSQELDRLELRPPPGFAASLRGVPYCSEPQILAAAANSGRAEQRASSCPSASQVGTTASGVGPGATPFYAPGALYLAGPYRAAPLSVVAVTPVLAGPFDLGNLVIRSALEVDRGTARVAVVTDTIPRVFAGIPLRVRDVRINLDRPGWVRTPTSCEAMVTEVSARGSNGAVARPSNRFQVGGCARLSFRPGLRIGLAGGTNRNGHPALTVRMTRPAGQANLRRAAVVLPRSELLAQSHIRSVCAREQFARDACPARSIYGRAEAETPLLDQPLSGPVYLRSSDHELPDLVAALSGPPRQPIEIDLVGRVDSVNGRIRASFGSIPDAPVSRFVLRMKGGRRSLLANSRDLCAETHRAGVHLVGQNGKRVDRSPVVRASCGKEQSPTTPDRLHR